MEAPIFNFISDDSHAWLQVPIAEIKRLNINTLISGSSYISEEHVFLEEDCDFPVFLYAYLGIDKEKEQTEEDIAKIRQFQINQIFDDSNSDINVRSLNHYYSAYVR